MNPYQKNLVFFLVAILVFFLSAPATASDGFTQKDRELLITLRVKVEAIDKRFEQIDKRFDQMMTFLWMLVGIFTAITASTIGFAIWDRRSMIRPFESKVKELEEGKIDKVISSLKTLAETDAKVAEILRRHNLL